MGETIYFSEEFIRKAKELVKNGKKFYIPYEKNSREEIDHEREHIKHGEEIELNNPTNRCVVQQKEI